LPGSKRPSHLRVDNRLLHGQVVQFWIPHLGIERLVIGSDAEASDRTMLTVYRMAIPSRIDLSVAAIPDLVLENDRPGTPSTMILVSDVFDAARAWMCGLEMSRVVVGNVHSAPDRVRITDSVYLSPEEEGALRRMQSAGISVEIQTFPGEALRLAGDGSGGWRWSKL